MKLFESLKNKKSIFMKLKPSQIKSNIDNKYIKLKATKNGFSLNIRGDDLNTLYSDNQLNSIFSTENESKYGRCVSCSNCQKCYGKGLMKI